jgi:hypothetical protein
MGDIGSLDLYQDVSWTPRTEGSMQTVKHTKPHGSTYRSVHVTHPEVPGKKNATVSLKENVFVRQADALDLFFLSW